MPRPGTGTSPRPSQGPAARTGTSPTATTRTRTGVAVRPAPITHAVAAELAYLLENPGPTGSAWADEDGALEQDVPDYAYEADSDEAPEDQENEPTPLTVPVRQPPVITIRLDLYGVPTVDVLSAGGLNLLDDPLKAAASRKQAARLFILGHALAGLQPAAVAAAGGSAALAALHPMAPKVFLERVEAYTVHGGAPAPTDASQWSRDRFVIVRCPGFTVPLNFFTWRDGDDRGYLAWQTMLAHPGEGTTELVKRIKDWTPAPRLLENSTGAGDPLAGLKKKIAEFQPLVLAGTAHDEFLRDVRAQFRRTCDTDAALARLAAHKFTNLKGIRMALSPRAAAGMRFALVQDFPRRTW